MRTPVYATVQACNLRFTASSQARYPQITGFPRADDSVFNVERGTLNGNIIRIGELEIRAGEFLVLADGRPLHLTARELALLSAFAERSGRIVGREELYTAVWQGPFRKTDRSIDVYVARLRAKLERELPDRTFIHTHFGFGYRFDPEPSRR